MISKTELKFIDTQYFNVIQEGCFAVYLQSKNTKHFWGIHVAEYQTFRNFKVTTSIIVMTHIIGTETLGTFR
jgi:hypothetical protein